MAEFEIKQMVLVGTTKDIRDLMNKWMSEGKGDYLWEIKFIGKNDW